MKNGKIYHIVYIFCVILHNYGIIEQYLIMDSAMDRRIIKTKKAIRTAFSTLIKEKPIEQITITELTERADIDRRTFYFHYNTIMDIVLEIENEVITQLDSTFSIDTDFEIDKFFNCLNEIVVNNYDFFKCITTQSNHYRMHKECCRILYNKLKDLFLEKSRLKEEIFSYYCEYITAGIMAVYIKWLAHPNDITLEQLCEIATSAVKESWGKICG